MRHPFPLALALLLLAAQAPIGSLCAEAVRTVAQRNRAFSVREIALNRGQGLLFTNEDDFPHQVYVRDAAFSFDSGLQGAGETLELAFPAAGTFQVRCGVHPRMLMTVTVR